MRRKVRIVLILVLLVLLGFAGHAAVLHFRTTHYYKAAQEALQRRDFAQARLHLNKVLSAWPKESSIRLLLAQAARRQGDSKEAFVQLRLCTRNNGPREAIALEQRLLRLQQGDLTELKMLMSFCGDYPEEPETPLILEAVIGQMLDDVLPADEMEPNRARVAEAARLADLQRSVDQWLRRYPEQADQVQGLVWHGRLRRLLGDHANALADFRKALTLAPDDFQAKLALAMAVAQDAPRETLALLEQLAPRAPENIRLRYYLASLQRVLGQWTEAGQILDEVLTANPDNVSCLIERGLLALDEKQPEVAQRWLRRALALDPRDPEGNHALSRCLHLLGKVEEAKRYQETFQQLDAERKRQ